MSLYESALEPFVFLEKTRNPDGEGGFKTTWTEGTEFPAATKLDTSMQARIAEKQGVRSLFTIYTKKSISFDFHDVIMRKSDGKIFRITSEGKENKTPDSAALNMRAVTAEEWELPS